ncbi:MAG: caspase family protein [Gammaproteobacteria bacterium]
MDHRAAFEELNAKLEAGTAEMRRQARRIARLQQEAGARQSRIAELERRQSAGQVPAQRSSTEALPVEPRALPRESFGAYHALVIGSNRYRHLPRLDTAVNDASALAEVLSKRYGFETTTLIDASRYQILSALNKLRERLTDRDNLVIYYAGHGELDEINQRGQWLPVDAELDSTANWISNAEVTDILNTMSAKHVLLIADSCYSGALTRASPGSRIAAGMSDQQRLTWIRIMVERRSRIALTSGGLEPVVDSGSGRHSVFAKALLEALSTNTEVLDGQRLFAAISGQVTYAASHLQVAQVPEYAPIKYAGHDGGEFFFVPTLR